MHVLRVKTSIFFCYLSVQVQNKAKEQSSNCVVERAGTGPEKTGNSPAELLKKYIDFAVSFVKKSFMSIAIKYMKYYAIDISIQNISKLSTMHKLVQYIMNIGCNHRSISVE